MNPTPLKNLNVGFVITEGFVAMNLTEDQQQAVIEDTHLSVIASAGTGKTTVLTQRFLNIHVKQQVPIYNIMAFTFTEKASQEMKERVLYSSVLSPELYGLLNIGTIHSYCHRFLKKHGHLLGLEPGFNIFDEQAHSLWIEDKIEHWIKSNLQSDEKTVVKFCKYYGYANLIKTTRKLYEQGLLSMPEKSIQCINHPDELDTAHITAFLKLIEKFSADLLSQKISHQTISYDDLEVLTLKILHEQKDILLSEQKKHCHILVDEFQDVSPRQFQLIKNLFNPEMNQLFIVGDPKQSIYGFRSADASLFTKMTGIIENHGGKAIYLKHTFRTPERLQSYFNEVFPKVLRGQTYHEAITHNPSQSFIDIHAAPETKLNSAELHEEISQGIASKINLLHKKGVAYEDMAILFYAKSSLPIYQKNLQKHTIPTLTEDKIFFLENPLILFSWHCLNYLSDIALKQSNKIHQIGILRNPYMGFSESFIEHLIKSEQEDLFNEQTLDLFSSQKDHQQWDKIRILLQKWQNLSDKLFAAELFQVIIDDILPNPDLQQTVIDERFYHMLRSLQSQDLFYLKDLRQELKELDGLDLKLALSPHLQKGVSLISIHASKGLEFDHVFLIPGRRKTSDSKLFARHAEGFIFKIHDCEFETGLKYKLGESENFSLIQKHEKNLANEELARLIYVALTRTKKHLHLYPNKVSISLEKALDKNPDDTKTIKSYNDWLYWLSRPREETTLDTPQQDLVLTNDTADEPKDYPIPDVETDTTPTLAANELIIQDFGRMPVFTPTEIETFTECPKRFALKYCQKVRPIKWQAHKLKNNKRTKLRLSPSDRGNLYHEILQFYDMRRDELDTVIERALFNQHLIDEDGRIKAECQLFMQNLRRDNLLRNFLFNNKESHEELSFSLNLNRFALTGQIDKLVKVNYENKDQWFIIDYKTHHVLTEQERSRLLKRFHFQMSCYALAITKKFDIPSIKSLILFTHGPTYFVFDHKQDELKEFETKLNHLHIAYLESLNSGTFPLTDEPDNCRDCAYYTDNYCGIKK
jgi:ATP-dependent exoDNAse (exonuclease V) beta subunit